MATTPEYESHSLVNSMNQCREPSDSYEGLKILDSSGINASDFERRCIQVLCCVLDESIAYNDSLQVTMDEFLLQTE